jgi:hypothetical protein
VSEVDSNAPTAPNPATLVPAPNPNVPVDAIVEALAEILSAVIAPTAISDAVIAPAAICADVIVSAAILLASIAPAAILDAITVPFTNNEPLNSATTDVHVPGFPPALHTFVSEKFEPLDNVTWSVILDVTPPAATIAAYAAASDQDEALPDVVILPRVPLVPLVPLVPAVPCAPCLALDNLYILVKLEYPALDPTTVTVAVSADIAVTVIVLLPVPEDVIVHPDAVELNVQLFVSYVNPKYTTALVDTPEKELTVPELSAGKVLFSSVKYISGVVFPLYTL